MNDREHFESHVKKEWHSTSLERSLINPDKYASATICRLWETWQAAIASQPAQEPFCYAMLDDDGVTVQGAMKYELPPYYTFRLYAEPQAKPAQESARIAELERENNRNQLDNASLSMKVKALEANLALAQDALEQVVVSGLLNGSCTLHEETRNKVINTLNAISSH